MSRLPRLRSSSPITADTDMDFGQLRQMPTTITTRGSLKRKAIPEEDEEDEFDAEMTSQRQPRKVAALGAARPARPLQPTRTATNGARSVSSSSSAAAPAPKPLTKPRAPVLSQPRPTRRGTSAPPTRGPGVTATAKPSDAAGRNPPGRTTSGSFSGGGPQNKRFTSIDSARAADAAQLETDMASERNKVAALQANHAQLSRDLAAARTQELNQRRELVGFSDEVDALKKKHAKEVMDLETDVKKRDRELREVKEDLALARVDLEREREVVGGLKNTLNQQSTAHMALEAQIQAMQAQNSLLQNQNDDFAHTVAEYQLQLESNEKKIAELKNEILESEIVRRKLHNMVQELKGNIRVFCRVRPVLSSDFINNPALSSSSPSSSTPSPTGNPEDVASAAAQISFPDASETQKQIALTSFSESATGQERRETHSFTFDRVFAPDATQSEVFEEISLLAQSCMDGYNVCIFAYGQTGSGKSFTMEGAQGPLAGMIPRAVEQVFRVAAEMKSKGWEYTIEGQFLEIYNETINDLLARGALNDKKKHEIKHDPKTGATRVTDITVVPLRSASQVQSLLALAHSRRSVAATLMNERSSRSHSIFTLRIAGVHVGLSSSSPSGSVGENGKHGLVGGTGERCNGCLNLVDLAGSERLNVSFASGPGAGLPDKERVKETQNINKSLSALGDVIAALGESGKADKGGEKGGHVPYRNSKLTYLLQNSLSGNSKTLMFLNLSPLRVHMNESLTSLRFATKVNNTHVGTAKKRSS